MNLYLDICAAGRLLAVGDSSFTQDLLLIFVIPVFIFNKHVFTQTVGRERHRSMIYCWKSLQPHHFHLSSNSRNSTHCFVPDKAQVERFTQGSPGFVTYSNLFRGMNGFLHLVAKVKAKATLVRLMCAKEAKQNYTRA